MQSGESGGHRYTPTLDVLALGYDPKSGRVEAGPGQVLYFTGDKCNLACKMCDSTFSDFHANVFPELVIPIEKVDPRYLANSSGLSAILEAKPKHVVLYGGEPFLARNIELKVSEILSRTQATISFLTNGSFDLGNHRVFRLMKAAPDKFSVTFSIDGHPALNETIRVGCDTAKIERNIRLCQREGIRCDAHFTLSNMNVWALPEFLEYVERFYDSNFEFNLASVEFPEHFAPNVLSDDVRRAVIIKLKRKYRDYVSGSVVRDDVLAALKAALLKVHQPTKSELIDRYAEAMAYMDGCIATRGRSGLANGVADAAA